MPEQKFLFSGAYLEEHKNAFGDDDCIMLLLSPTAFFLLADMSRMLLWPTRYEEKVVPEEAWEYYRQMNNPSCVQVDVNVDFSEMAQQMEDLIKAIVEKEIEMINNQTVNINKGCGCGCTCGQSVCQCNQIDDTMLPPNDYDVPDIDPDNPVVPVAGASKCDRSGYLLIQYRNSVLTAIEGLEGGYQSFVDWFDSLVAWLSSSVPLSYDVYMSIKEWANMGAFTNTDDFLAGFDPNFDSMLCAMYSSSSADNAKTAVRAILENYVWSGMSPYARLASKRLFELMPFDLIFDASIDADIPPGYQGRTCCGGVPESYDFDQNLPESYRLVPAVFESFENTPASANEATVTQIEDFVKINFQTQDSTSYGLQTNVFWVDPEIDPLTENVVGMVFQCIDFQAIENRRFKLVDNATWGYPHVVVSGSPGVPLYPDREPIQSIIYQYNNHPEALTVPLESIGELTLDNGDRDGAYTSVLYELVSGEPSQDKPTGSITFRAFHIIHSMAG